MQDFLMVLNDVPPGFAILLTGLSFLVAMIILVVSLHHHRGDAASAELQRSTQEIAALKTAVNAELIAYIRATILATSNSNLVTEAHGEPQGQTYFGDPIIFRSIASKIGLLADVTLVGALVIFYENMIQLNGEFQRIMLTEEPLPVDYDTVSYRLRLMCYNLALALEILNGNDMPKIPSDIKSTELWDRKGASVWTGSPRPATLNELLRAL